MPPSVIVAAGPVRVVRLTPGPVRMVRTNTPQPVRVLSLAQQGRPGGKGDPGERGLPGSVAGTLPYTSITGVPVARQETFLVTARGAQSILLAQTPLPGSLALYWDGVRQFNLSDLTLTGNNLIVPASWPLVAGDTLSFTYLS